MVRSFTERLIGGVCGGLSHRTPINASLWRLIWLALAIVAPPAAVAAYLLWWWLIPLESPFRKHTAPLSTLIALVLTVIVFVAWFGRASLVTPTGQDAYIPFVGLILAGAFLYRQIQSRSWANMLIALVLLAVPLLLLLGAFNILPGGLFDLIGRALPGVLIFLGLALLLRGRVPYASPIALFATVVVIVALATTAIASRTNRDLVTDPVIATQDVAPNVTTLQLNVESLTTKVRFQAAAPGVRTITVTFTGSTENELTQDYVDDGTGLATYTVRETRPNPYPRLENLGRGNLIVEIPADVGVSLAFAGQDGDAEFDLQGTSLERLNLELENGDVVLTLPAYQPRSPGVLDNPGELLVLDGDLQILVPAEVGGRFEIPENSTPTYDEAQYRIEVARPSWLLLARNYDTATMKANYRLTVPRGTTELTVQP
jgi:phage shock protein PspC (stress-responsive transcriptional regulator)